MIEAHGVVNGRLQVPYKPGMSWECFWPKRKTLTSVRKMQRNL
jgi:hypothetical protein